MKNPVSRPTIVTTAFLQRLEYIRFDTRSADPLQDPLSKSSTALFTKIPGDRLGDQPADGFFLVCCSRPKSFRQLIRHMNSYPHGHPPLFMSIY